MGSDREIAEDGVIDECMRVSHSIVGTGCYRGNSIQK